MKHTLFFALGLLCLGCPNGSTGSDGGESDGDIEPTDIEIDVSGTARVHPAAVDFLNTNGRAVPSIEGLTLRVEEPLKVALHDPLGEFGTVILDGGGAFRVNAVPVQLVNLGIAAGIRDETDAGVCGADAGVPDGGCKTVYRVVRSATVLYDVALEQKKPETDITGAVAFAIPTDFHEQLTAAVTPATILQITGANQKSTLLEAGFMLGRIVDAQGNPVANAKVAPSPAALASQFFYPTSDLSGTQGSTSANGLFVFVHTGGDVNTFRFTIEGKSEYRQRNAGAAKDACLVVTVYPGTTPPP
ncbi:MAG: carboxypeptidase regulatory-like domain-containing protein [Myxococcota bacterium]